MSKPHLALAALFVTLGLLGCNGDGAGESGLPVTVMTRNLYLGSDLTPLALISKPADVPNVTAALWANVQASNFPERAQVLAAQIVAAAPDLVALQEVSLYRRQ